MAITPQQIIAPSVLTASAATYYTTPASTKCIIRSLTFCNVTAGAITITVHLVPSGGTAGVGNTIIKEYSIAAKATYTPSHLVNHVLPAATFIQALASGGTAITVFGSGTEVT